MPVKLLMVGSILLCLAIGVYFISTPNMTRPSALRYADEPPSESLETETLVSVPLDIFSQEIARNVRVLIDVRTPGEYSSGHIEGAQNINFYSDDFETQLRLLNPSAEYAIYCRSGSRSAQAIALMRNLSFSNVIELRGGITEWEKAGNSVCTEC